MEGIYEVSSSEKVRSLEEDLKKELKELQNEVEEGNFLSSSSAPKAFGSVPLPKDVEHFKRERKLAINKSLQVREAQPLIIQADVMREEMTSCCEVEYTGKSIPLLLHQFFVDRIEHLVQCKHMHMLRWARFCEHTKAIENLYPVYQKRLSYIMEEYHDCLQRARRLAVACEATLTGSDSAMSVVTMDDLLIYTRWFICMLHSVKKINGFIRTIEWLPSTHKNSIQPQTAEKEEKPPEQERKMSTTPGTPSKARGQLKKILSQVSITAHLHVLRPTTVPDADLPPPPPLSLSPYQLVSGTNPSIAAAAAASGGGLASDEINLKLPLHETSLGVIKPLLEFLMTCYAVEMDINQINTHADEMDLFTMVTRRFKKVFSKQEQMRTFPVYDASIEEFGDSKIRGEGALHTFKQHSNWISFNPLRPEQTSTQVKAMTKLRQKGNIDELLRAHSRFLHVQDGQRVLGSLKEHAKAVLEPPKPQSASVTTYRTQHDTAAVWKRIFSYASVSLSSKDDVLEFDTKISEDDMGGSSNSAGEFDLGTAVELLGLDDEDAKTQASRLQGAYMSFLLLRHLRLRDLQRSCLGILNYFRSTERTLTINNVGLSLEGGKQKASKHQVFHGGGITGVGSHQYIHNTPADYRVEQSEFMEFSEVENHDDFFTTEEGRVHIQDQRGYYIMYDSALADFKELETELLLVATHFIEKDKDFRLPRNLRGDHIDLAAYGHQQVDRFAALLDLWTNEVAYLENKRQLLDCYLEAYHHVLDIKEKNRLAQVMINVMQSRPRFDFTADYFVKIYRAECVCLRLHCSLIKSVLDKQIDEEREYIQKVCREDNPALFGLPHRIVPQQHIAVNTSRPALKYIYMLEFHPSLGLASRVYESLQNALKMFIQIHKPKSTGEMISLERRLYEVVQKEWDSQEPVGHSFAQQTQKDLFSEVFAEDPIFVCEVAQSLVNRASESKKGGRKSVKEKQKILTDVWSKLLEVITLRHRLITSGQETDVVTKAYRRKAKEIGFDEYHAFLRAVSFDFAQTKPEAEIQNVLVTIVTEDDSRVDRYTPAYTPLAIQELDEKHLGSFSFRTREGFLQIMSGAGVEKLQTILSAQIVHKNLIISSILQLDSCAKVISAEKAKAVETEKSAGLSPRSSHDTSLTSRASSAEAVPAHLAPFSTKRMDREFERKLQEVFVSVQLEKTSLRDKMLNDYIHKKEQMGTVMKNIDEVIKLKRKLVTDFCENLHKRVSQYSLQSQIIAYSASLLNLMSDFPTTRDAHFVIGEEDEKKTEEDDKISSDPKHFTPRPRRLLSSDGKNLLNLWFIPHYTEIIKMFPKMKVDERNAALKVMLKLISSLHDICQYLCAHARLGSSHARLGSQKLEFSGVTADWGGTEGIGAELREIQKQINHLENPLDPQEVAEFLAKRRDNMFLEFDISISHSVRDTFLSTGNEVAYKSITENMHFALKNLSNLPRSCIYSPFISVPEPLEPKDQLTKNLYPWRSFSDRYGPFPMMYWPWDLIGENMQLCLAGLRDVDRHVVNGEILGVSLLLEDVLQNGLPDIFTQQPDDSTLSTTGQRSRPSTSTSRRPPSRHGDTHDSTSDGAGETVVAVETGLYGDIPKGTISFSTNPKVAVKLINLFLLVCSRLELLKTDWGCRKLGVNEIFSSKLYRTLCKIYKIEILQPVYQQIAVRMGQGQEYAALGALVNDDEPLSSPPGSTEMELKVKQLIRLLENLECTMIYDVIRRISREHTLVVSERGRDDATLPTDLWKKPVMKENCTIAKPHLVENFIQDLMSEHTNKGDNVTFTKDHLDKCLVKLASETMLRERNCFESYAMYYENLLRHQHQLLYIKEQEIKQHLDTIEANSSATIVDVHCQLADRSHEQLLEITALRAKIAEMRESLMNQEKELRERVKSDFASLVQELFTNCFSMKNRFEEFRLFLHDDVHEGLSDVRRKAVEDMKKLREKSGTLKEESEAASKQVLAKSEQIRRFQEENKHLGQLFLKIKTMNNWKRTRLFIRYHDSVEGLRDEADRAKRECLEVKKIAEEKEVLFKQEQSALRKALSEVERECQKLRKKLQYEQKTKLQKMHAQMQEAHSMRQLELAKSTNIDKLISDLEEKELQLRLLTQNLDRDQRRNLFAQEQSKKALKQMMLQLDHERHLKLDAFERVEDLQRQIYEYEQHLTSGLSRPGSGAGSRSASRTDKRPLSSYRTVPESFAASPLFVPSVAARQTKPVNVVSPLGGGVWPPPVMFPMRQATTPDPGVSSSYSPPPKIQRPKTHTGRLRGTITDSLLGDLEPDEVPETRLPPRV
ncbi:unnamed protein product [Porites lobata]|uniref:DUF4549 domain-containing protein n=1 Tax=Porites lobata TaxID=104759 RepID=A0ABN8RND9_9CNID|nr:unnamed protein product [Porites lobata]